MERKVKLLLDPCKWKGNICLRVLKTKPKQENLVMDKKDNRVFISLNYRSELINAPWKFDVLKISIFAL